LLNSEEVGLRLSKGIEEGLSGMEIPDEGRSKLRVSSSVKEAITGVRET